MSYPEGPPPAYSQVGAKYAHQPNYGPAQQQYGPPQPGFGLPQQPYAPPQPDYGRAQQYPAPPNPETSHAYLNTSNVVVVSQPGVSVIRPGGCGYCGGRISESFTAVGILLALCFFPLGVICCFLLMEKRCDSCGRSF